MRAVEQPSSVRRYHEVGGVVWFTTFEDADGSEETALTAIGSAIPEADLDALRAISCRQVDDPTFYGEWWHPASDSLLLLGDYKLSDDRSVANARLQDLKNVSIVSGGSTVPEPGSGGQFAYAFSHPPYGLRATYPEVQDLFNKIRHFVLPRGVDHLILDWSSPHLPRVSGFFDQGMEWWGVFLFTAYVPEWRRLTVMTASTTD